MSENSIELKAPTAELVSKILSFSRDGLTRKQIHQWSAELPEPTSPEEIDKAILLAHDELARSADINPDIEAGRSIARLHDLYARLHQTGDLRGCLSVQKELSALLGLSDSNHKQQLRRMAAAIIDIAGNYIEKTKQGAFLGEIKRWMRKTGA